MLPIFLESKNKQLQIAYEKLMTKRGTKTTLFLDEKLMTTDKKLVKIYNFKLDSISW